MKSLYLFLIAPVFFVGLFVLYPLAQVFVLSFESWSGFTRPIYIGWTNFEVLVSDPIFQQALTNNFIWVVVFMVVNNSVGLFLAGTVDIMGRRLSTFFRIVLYLSVLLPNVVVSYLFLALYDP